MKLCRMISSMVWKKKRDNFFTIYFYETFEGVKFNFTLSRETFYPLNVEKSFSHGYRREMTFSNDINDAFISIFFACMCNFSNSSGVWWIHKKKTNSFMWHSIQSMANGWSKKFKQFCILWYNFNSHQMSTQ